MALHGEIRVNHQHPILYWTARRLKHLEPGVDSYKYEWEVEQESTTFTGTLWHNYSEGAVVLAIKVLTAYFHSMRIDQQ